MCPSQQEKVELVSILVSVLATGRHGGPCITTTWLCISAARKGLPPPALLFCLHARRDPRDLNGKFYDASAHALNLTRRDFHNLGASQIELPDLVAVGAPQQWESDATT